MSGRTSEDIESLSDRVGQHYPGMGDRVIRRDVRKEDVVRIIRDALDDKVPAQLARDMKAFWDSCNREPRVAHEADRPRASIEPSPRRDAPEPRPLESLLEAKRREGGDSPSPVSDTIREIRRLGELGYKDLTGTNVTKGEAEEALSQMDFSKLGKLKHTACQILPSRYCSQFNDDAIQKIWSRIRGAYKTTGSKDKWRLSWVVSRDELEKTR